MESTGLKNGVVPVLLKENGELRVISSGLIVPENSALMTDGIDLEVRPNLGLSTFKGMVEVFYISENKKQDLPADFSHQIDLVLGEPMINGDDVDTTVLKAVEAVQKAINIHNKDVIGGSLVHDNSLYEEV